MYKVSVVTPFHNVDMGMFEKCAESMRCQSIGFNNIEWIIVVHNSEPLTVDERRMLCDMAAPYLKKLRKMTPSKLHSPEECYLSYHLPQEVLSNAENPMESPLLKDAQNGWQDLIKILRVNASTDYGMHYHFDQTETLSDYQQLVPLTDYENYKRLIDLQTNIGESGILTSANVQQYLVNAKGQRFPCTDEHLQPSVPESATWPRHA